MSIDPIVVFGIPDIEIRLWEFIRDLEIMINNLRWKWGRPPAHRVWVDSGGYQIMVRGLRIELSNIIDRYKELNADIYISLDHPPQELCARSKDIIMRNIANFEKLYTRLDDKLIVPVIHCYKADLILEALDIYKSYGIEIIAYGGAVPPSLAKFGRGSRITPFIALALLRKVFNGWIHVLGIGGSPSMYQALKTLGVNSLDSSSWRTKAAYGKVIIPGLGERYVGNGEASFGRKDLNRGELESLIKALRTTNFPFIDSIEDMVKTFYGRALINAWIIKYYAGMLLPSNGYSWLINYIHNFRQLSIEELIEKLNFYMRNIQTN